MNKNKMKWCAGIKNKVNKIDNKSNFANYYSMLIKKDHNHVNENNFNKGALGENKEDNADE